MNLRTMMLATAVSATTAFASQANTANFGGFYAGGSLGVSHFSTGISINGIPGLTAKEKKDNALIGGGHFGYGTQVSGPLYLGAELGINGVSTTNTITTTDNNGADRTKAKGGLGYDASVRIGYAISESFMPYIKTGMGSRNISFKLEDGEQLKKKYNGWLGAVGFEWKASPSFVVGAEANHTRHTKKKVTVDDEVIKYHPKETNVLVRISYLFGK